MLNKPKIGIDLLDPKLVDIEEWNLLIEFKEFKKLEEFIHSQILRHNRMIKQLGKAPTQDNLTEIACRLARIDELETLFHKKEHYIREKLKVEKEKQ